MNFKPILFSGPMVQAILQDRKTQTRRIVTPQPQREGYLPELLFDHFKRLYLGFRKSAVLVEDRSWKAKYGQSGDVLWVRETIYQNGELGLEYVADKEQISEEIIPLDFNVRLDKKGNYKFCKIPNIYMEKWACRLFLKIKSIRVEKLQSISEEDAIAEGVLKDVALPVENFKTKMLYRDYTGKTAGCEDARSSFMTLWISINGEESWKKNPWVWVIDFERIERPETFLK